MRENLPQLQLPLAIYGLVIWIEEENALRTARGACNGAPASSRLLDFCRVQITAITAGRWITTTVSVPIYMGNWAHLLPTLISCNYKWGESVRAPDGAGQFLMAGPPGAAKAPPVFLAGFLAPRGPPGRSPRAAQRAGWLIGLAFRWTTQMCIVTTLRAKLLDLDTDGKIGIVISPRHCCSCKIKGRCYCSKTFFVIIKWTN